MGFANPLVFKNVNEELINKLEQFIRVKLNSQFELLPGERLLIKELVAHVEQIVDKGGKNTGIQHFCESDTSIESPKKIQTAEKTEKKHELINTRSHFLLEKFLIAADKNSTRNKGGYDTEIKQYASYLRMICGPLAYETIQTNLTHSLPSLSSTNRYIKLSNCSVIEGILRTEELLIYLQERNLPLVVSLSEDATSIIGRVQYDSSSNQVVGFTLPLNKSNGMPIPYSFPARTAEEI